MDDERVNYPDPDVLQNRDYPQQLVICSPMI